VANCETEKLNGGGGVAWPDVNGGGEVFSNFNLHMFYWGKHKIFEERKN
jgi:hypothetical protein